MTRIKIGTYKIGTYKIGTYKIGAYEIFISTRPEISIEM